MRYRVPLKVEDADPFAVYHGELPVVEVDDLVRGAREAEHVARDVVPVLPYPDYEWLVESRRRQPSVIEDRDEGVVSVYLSDHPHHRLLDAPRLGEGLFDEVRYHLAVCFAPEGEALFQEALLQNPVVVDYPVVDYRELPRA